jgi:hypothetical protein
VSRYRLPPHSKFHEPGAHEQQARSQQGDAACSTGEAIGKPQSMRTRLFVFLLIENFLSYQQENIG